MQDDARANHTPNRSIRIGDELWDALGEAFGERQRSALFSQYAAWALRRPGAKTPPRVPLSPSSD